MIPAEVAAHVLYFFGRSGGYAPGNFVQALLTAISRADAENRARMFSGFPDYCTAMAMGMYGTDGGLDKLAEFARSPHDSSKRKEDLQ